MNARGSIWNSAPLLLAALLLAGCVDKEPVRPPAIGSISGRVTDQNGSPLAGVAISMEPATRPASTGDDGVYTIGDIEARIYRVTARKSGYDDGSVMVTVTGGMVATADITLKRRSLGTKGAPDVPRNRFPLDSAFGEAPGLTLQWICSDPENDPLRYDLYLGTSNPPLQKVATGIADTALAPAGLALATTYYWRVVARDSAGNERAGDVWRFSTATKDAPKGAGDALLLPAWSGVPGHVLVERSDRLYLSNGSFTLEAWLKLFSIEREYTTFLNRGYTNFETDYLLGVDSARVVFQTRSWGNLLFGPLMETGRWYHVAAVHDQTNGDLMIYLDGERVAWQKLNGGPVNTTAPLLIGARLGTGGAAEGIEGMLDEVRIWDRARTPEEIRSTMRRALTGEERGLRAYWRFDEGSDSTAADNSGHGHKGMLKRGADWAVSDAPLE